MEYTMEQYRASAQAIQARLDGFVPDVAMVLGSGLGYLGDEVEDAVAIEYRDIPHFKVSTAPGHKGRLVFGKLVGHCGMEVLGLTLLSNMAAGILDQPLSEKEVLDAAAAAREKFSGLVRACLRNMEP